MALRAARSDSRLGRNGLLSASVLAIALKLESLPKDRVRWSRCSLSPPAEEPGDVGAAAMSLSSRRGGRLVRPLPLPRRRGWWWWLPPLLLPPPKSSLVSSKSPPPPPPPRDRLLLCLGVIFMMWTRGGAAAAAVGDFRRREWRGSSDSVSSLPRCR